MRHYDMRRRGKAAAATRARILEAAHELLNEGAGGSLTLLEVADAAGVSRATVYNSVGSRRDLLATVFEDQGRRIGYERVLSAMRLEDPAQAVSTAVRESCRAWSVIPAAIRKTLALAVIDAEISALVDRYERYRRGEIAAFARRLHRSGALRPGLTQRDAAATLTVLTGFPAYDQLSLEYSVSSTTRHLVRIATTALGVAAEEEE